ncbi:MAG: hypothetical protein WCG81_13030, partial [Candidatus Angelobacter sp.]
SDVNTVLPSQSSAPASLHERISLDLAKSYEVDDLISDPSGPDLVIRQGSRIAFVEVKTGSPNLPLPSSTVAQMNMLTVHAKKKVDPTQGVEIVPVLVTNYQVSPADRQELGDQGIKIVEVSSGKSVYNSTDLVKNFSNIVGFQHEKLV